MSLPTRSKGLSVFDIVIFAVFGAMMYVSRLALAVLPNIHLIAMFVMTLTAVYRIYALIPLYVYVFLEGLMGGFSLWWMPYLYIWTLLWGACMLLPKNISAKASYVIYPLLGALHGILYGVLYAPAQALMFHLGFEGMLAWIASGFIYDVLHAAGNFAAGFLVYPLSRLLVKLNSIYRKKR
jgi:energy-coupling factor transport system substrate-specific component